MKEPKKEKILRKLRKLMNLKESAAQGYTEGLNVEINKGIHATSVSENLRLK